MTSPLIQLQNVWKIYSLGKVELTVLRDINLEINPGSFVAIMGPSGSGKSTLMYLLGLLDVPTKGKIFLEGKDISEFSEDELAKLRAKKIGFVFQQFNLLSNLTALENVTLPMVFQGIAEEKRKERGGALLGAINMKERMLHRPLELSGGEQQRVAMARAFANEPEIIIADEPTGNLDSQTGKMIMEVLTDFHKNQRKTIIVVTHDKEVASYSERIINLRDGQIV